MLVSQSINCNKIKFTTAELIFSFKVMLNLMHTHMPAATGAGIVYMVFYRAT